MIIRRAWTFPLLVDQDPGPPLVDAGTGSAAPATPPDLATPPTLAGQWRLRQVTFPIGTVGNLHTPIDQRRGAADSNTLGASPLGHALPGWTLGVAARDLRSSPEGAAVSSLDPTTERVPVDVVLPTTTGEVVLPALGF